MESNLSKIMKEQNISIRSLAYLSGVSPTTIYKAKHNISECSISTLQKIAMALNVELKELFTS